MPSVRSNVPSVAWPPIARGSAGTLANLVEHLDETQWVAPEAVTAAQFRQLGVLAGALVELSPAFRRRLQRADLGPADLTTPSGLARVPPLTRQEVADGEPGFFAAAVPEDHGAISVAKTSGSTGAPVAVRKTALTTLLWDALTIRDHLWRQLDFRARLLANRFSLTGPVDRPDWGPPVSLLYDSGPLQAVPLIGAHHLADRVVAFDPEVLVVRPSVLDELLLDFIRRGHRPPSLRHVHTYGEPLSPRVRLDAADALDVTIWDTYSCEEIGNLAAGCPDGDRNHVLAEGVLLEVLDDDDRPCGVGEIGRVVLTDLHNLATPMVRYDIGDYAEVAPPCGCRRGLPSLGRIVGRERNRVRLPDGRWHWPRFDTLARYQEAAPVRQLQLVQRDDGHVDVDAVVDGSVTARHEAALTVRLHAALGHKLPLRFAWRDRALPRTAGGKFERFRRDEP